MESIYLINILFIHHRETKKQRKSIQVYIGLSESQIFAIGWLPSLLVCYIMLYYFFVVVVVNAGNAHVYFFISYIIFFCPDINRLVFVGVWGFIFIYFLLFPRERTKFFTTKYLYRRKIYSRWKFWDNKQQSYFFFCFDLKSKHLACDLKMTIFFFDSGVLGMGIERYCYVCFVYLRIFFMPLKWKPKSESKMRERQN